ATCAAGSSSASSPGFNGSAASLFAGNTTPTISSALSRSPASSSSSNDFEIGSNDKYARPRPLPTIQTNIGATANLLDMARRQSWRRLLFVSTGSVFQTATDATKPILEDAQPSATHVYSTTKYCGELLTRMYRMQFDLSASVVRVSWVYGPPLVTDDPPRGPIPAFLKAVLKRQAIRLPSGADFAASFTYVSDVAAGLLAAWRACELHHD